MEIQYNPANFEAMFTNRFPSTEVYNLIRCTPCLKTDITPSVMDETGNYFSLELSNNYVDKHGYGNKEEWVSNAIKFTIFNKSRLFLYKHEGIFGYYNFTNKTFNRFTEDISQIVYKFYYDNMSLQNCTSSMCN
jgi:hypothetical protein